MIKKTHKIISSRYAEDLLDQLNELGSEGWSIALYVQEFGLTKIILEKEI